MLDVEVGDNEVDDVAVDLHLLGVDRHEHLDLLADRQALVGQDRDHRAVVFRRPLRIGVAVQAVLAVDHPSRPVAAREMQKARLGVAEALAHVELQAGDLEVHHDVGREGPALIDVAADRLQAVRFDHALVSLKVLVRGLRHVADVGDPQQIVRRDQKAVEGDPADPAARGRDARPQALDLFALEVAAQQLVARGPLQDVGQLAEVGQIFLAQHGYAGRHGVLHIDVAPVDVAGRDRELDLELRCPAVMGVNRLDDVLAHRDDLIEQGSDRLRATILCVGALDDEHCLVVLSEDVQLAPRRAVRALH